MGFPPNEIEGLATSFNVLQRTKQIFNGKNMGERKHNKTGRKKEEVVKLCGADPNESDDVPLQDIQQIYDLKIYIFL